ncbi:MAG: carboxypeptidase regulatory-like domain-containing protein, partial [Thermoplasmata archaeon]
LKGWLSPLLNRSWAASTAFLLAFDEGSNNSGFSTSGTSTPTCTTSGATSACGGQVWMVAVSPYSKAAVASDYTATATHYNLLSTAEWLLGLGSTGHNDSGGSFAPMKALFASPVPDPGNFTVTGRVGVQSTGSAIPGADVAILGGASTVTNASGTFEFRLADGNYSLSASASGFAPSSSRVEVNGSNVSITLALVPLPPSTYSVSGVVEYAANGTPATGANLSLSGVGSAVTGTNGTFRFLAENGSYTLAIRLPGFVAQQVKVGVAGSSVIQDISLVRIAPLTYLLDGTVRSVATHAPIIGANVSVTPSVWDTTNSSGRYEFQLSNGTYTVQVSDKGYLTTHADVTLLGAPVAEDFSIASGSASSVPGNSSNSSTPTAPQPSPPTVFGPSVPVSVWPILAVAGAVVLAAGAVLRRRRRHRA